MVRHERYLRSQRRDNHQWMPSDSQLSTKHSPRAEILMKYCPSTACFPNSLRPFYEQGWARALPENTSILSWGFDRSSSVTKYLTARGYEGYPRSRATVPRPTPSLRSCIRRLRACVMGVTTCCSIFTPWPLFDEDMQQLATCADEQPIGPRLRAPAGLQHFQPSSGGDD